MFLKPITKKGVTRLYLYESYYIDGKVTQRCYQSLGRLDELQKQYPDPIAYFKEQAAIITKEKNESRNLTISIDLNEPWIPKSKIPEKDKLLQKERTKSNSKTGQSI